MNRWHICNKCYNELKQEFKFMFCMNQELCSVYIYDVSIIYDGHMPSPERAGHMSEKTTAIDTTDKCIKYLADSQTHDSHWESIPYNVSLFFCYFTENSFIGKIIDENIRCLHVVLMHRISMSYFSINHCIKC